jgi:hypothetical protein
MADTWDLVIRRLGERRSELVEVLAAVRDRAEDLVLDAEAASRHTCRHDAVERTILAAVRVRDAVDGVLKALQDSRGVRVEAHDVAPTRQPSPASSARRRARGVVANRARTSPPA